MAVATANRFQTESRAVSYTAADWGIFFIRVVLGVIFFMHGAQKVLGMFGGPGLEGTVGFMGKMGVPAFLAYVSAFTEFLGGIFLVFGFLSRISAIGLFINMLVAVALVHLKNGFFMQTQGYEYNLALMAMALGIAIGGPGALHITDLERKVVTKS